MTTNQSPTKSPVDAAIQSPNKKVAKTLEYRVLRLLVAQYRATGNAKDEHVLAGIAKRIKRLGGRPPFVAVAAKRTAACVELVESALFVIPLLSAFGKHGSILDNWFVNSVSCALADAYKMAAGPLLAGFEFDVLSRVTAQLMAEVGTGDTPESVAKRVSQEKWKIIDAMALPLASYQALLDGIPTLACHANEMCGLWLRDRHHAGKPLPQLVDDVKEIARFADHIHPAAIPGFNSSVAEALRAIDVRMKSPLCPANIYECVPMLFRIAEVERGYALQPKKKEQEENPDLDSALDKLSMEQLEQLNAEIAGDMEASVEESTDESAEGVADTIRPQITE